MIKTKSKKGKKKSPSRKRSSSSSSSPKIESYINFANRVRPRMIERYPNMSPLEITKEIAKEWRLYQYFSQMSLSELKIEAEKYGCYIAQFL
jgi:hypothetical protein